MSRFLTMTVLLICLPASLATALDFEQTDWSGGPGDEGPVADWAAAFDSATDVSWRSVPGALALSSTPRIVCPQTLLNDAYIRAFSVETADLDGDGDIDVAGTAEGSGVISTWLNRGTVPPTWDEQVVTDSFPEADGLFLADLDGDGDVDILANASTPTSEIAWWRNDGGDPLVWTKQPVASGWTTAFEIHADDIDGDGRIDVVCTDWPGDRIGWWRNGGGDPIAWTQQIVDPLWDGPHSVRSGDFDGDGRTDLVACAGLASEVAWYRNGGGEEPQWTKHVIRTGFAGARSVAAGDVDDDGDDDIVAVCWGGYVNCWYNDGGDPVQWTQQSLFGSFSGGHAVRLVDLDGDGRLDVLGAAFSADDLAWWRNGGGSPAAWERRTIDTNHLNVIEVGTGDLDGDGMLEVLATSYFYGSFDWWDITESVASGTLTSSILETGGVVPASVDWSADIPAGTGLGVQIRSGADAHSLGEWSAPITAPGPLPDTPGPVLQYRVTLESSEPELSPVLRDLVFAADASGVSGAAAAAALAPAVHPNPANPRLTIAFSLERAQRVRVSIHDAAGRRVARLWSGFLEAGRRTLDWDGRNDTGEPAASGVYLARVVAEEGSAVTKLTLVR